LICTFRPINTLVWESCNSFFKFILNVKLELSHFTNWIIFLVINFFEMIILFSVNIKLNTIVSGSDCFNIKVNELVHLNTFEVVEIHNCEQVDEDSYWCCNQTKFFPLFLVVFWNHANSLRVKYWVGCTCSYTVSRLWN